MFYSLWREFSRSHQNVKLFKAKRVLTLKFLKYFESQKRKVFVIGIYI